MLLQLNVTKYEVDGRVSKHLFSKNSVKWHVKNISGWYRACNTTRYNESVSYIKVVFIIMLGLFTFKHNNMLVLKVFELTA